MTQQPASPDDRFVLPEGEELMRAYQAAYIDQRVKETVTIQLQGVDRSVEFKKGENVQKAEAFFVGEAFSEIRQAIEQSGLNASEQDNLWKELLKNPPVYNLYVGDYGLAITIDIKASLRAAVKNGELLRKILVADSYARALSSLQLDREDGYSCILRHSDRLFLYALLKNGKDLDGQPIDFDKFDYDELKIIIKKNEDPEFVQPAVDKLSADMVVHALPVVQRLQLLREIQGAECPRGLFPENQRMQIFASGGAFKENPFWRDTPFNDGNVKKWGYFDHDRNLQQRGQDVKPVIDLRKILIEHLGKYKLGEGRKPLAVHEVVGEANRVIAEIRGRADKEVEQARRAQDRAASFEEGYANLGSEALDLAKREETTESRAKEAEKEAASFKEGYEALGSEALDLAVREEEVGSKVKVAESRAEEAEANLEMILRAGEALEKTLIANNGLTGAAARKRAIELFMQQVRTAQPKDKPSEEK